MRSSKPMFFSLSGFLLRFALSQDAEAIQGDLLEGYHQRRGRQVGRLLASFSYWLSFSWVVAHTLKDRLSGLDTKGARGGSAGLWRQRIRFALRSFRLTPGFTIIAVLTLAMGIGATSVMFSIIEGFGRPLPVPNGQEIHRVVWIEAEHPQAERGFGREALLFLRSNQSSFRDLAGFWTGSATLRTVEGFPYLRPVAHLTSNTFRVLEVEPHLGRFFTEGEQDVVVISHGLWEEIYGGDPAVVGESLSVDGRIASVVGVMPEGFAFPFRQQLWVPLVDPTRAGLDPEGLEFELLGRLSGDLSVERVQSQLAALRDGLWAAEDARADNRRVLIKGFTEGRGEGGELLILRTMFLVVVLLLLVAIGNSMSLLLARSVERVRDLSLHSALGARGSQLILNLLTESTLLALGAGLVGIVSAYAVVGYINHTISSLWGYFWMDVKVDAGVFLFTAGVVLASGILVGLIPAFRTARIDPNHVLSGGRSAADGSRLSGVLRFFVTGELALSCVAVVVTALIVRNMLGPSDLGESLRVDEVVMATVSPPQEQYPDSESRVGFIDQLRLGLLDRPEVEAVAIGFGLPGWGERLARVELSDRVAVDLDINPVIGNAVDPGFFETFGIRPLRGRLLERDDRLGTERVAVISEGLAKEFFSDSNPIGQQIQVDFGGDPEDRWTIVGVVSDLEVGGEGTERIYLPIGQVDFALVHVGIRARGDTGPVAEIFREVLFERDPDLVPSQVSTLEETLLVGRSFYNTSGRLTLLGGIGTAAIAMIGLFGVLSFYVRRRVRELGVRIALGSTSWEVLGLVLRRGLIHLLPGLVLGLGLALLVVLRYRRFLLSVGAPDPWFLVVIPFAFLMTGLVAAVFPALAATRVDPMRVLREE